MLIKVPSSCGVGRLPHVHLIEVAKVVTVCTLVIAELAAV